MKKPGLVSLPVVLIAVLMLALGSFGTATASGLTAHAVKKIAKKVVLKQAPGLSVAHANTANAATTASNATALGGLAPSSYLDRATQRESTGGIPLTAGARTNLLGPASITIPTGVNFLQVDTSVSFSGLSSNVISWFQVDDASCLNASGLSFTDRPFGNTGGGATAISQSLVVPITAGTHTVTLCGEAGNTSQSTLSTIFVARTLAGGSTGGTTLAFPHHANVDADHNDTTPQ